MLTEIREEGNPPPRVLGLRLFALSFVALFLN
jgi:hypothetical protein